MKLEQSSDKYWLVVDNNNMILLRTSNRLIAERYLKKHAL